MDDRSRSTDAAVFRFILRRTSFLIGRVASGAHNLLLRNRVRIEQDLSGREVDEFEAE
jgi:hypothetical protein